MIATAVAIRPSDMRPQMPILVFSVIFTFHNTMIGSSAHIKSVMTEYAALVQRIAPGLVGGQSLTDLDIYRVYPDFGGPAFARC
jgi:hypothetical protein